MDIHRGQSGNKFAISKCEMAKFEAYLVVVVSSLWNVFFFSGQKFGSKHEWCPCSLNKTLGHANHKRI